VEEGPARSDGLPHIPYPCNESGRRHIGTDETGLSWSTVAERSGLPFAELIHTERGSVPFNPRRVAEFDWELLRSAAELNGATEIALTFVDYLDRTNRDARRYDQLQPATILFIEEVERVAGAPVTLIGTRFDPRVEWPGAVCADGEDGVGRDGGADRVFLPAGVAGDRAHRVSA
jgi:hypothetical protein